MACANGLRLNTILETHRNEDQAIGSAESSGRAGTAIWHAGDELPCECGKAATDGQVWKVGRQQLEAITSPGHTPGSMSHLLRDPSGRALHIELGTLPERLAEAPPERPLYVFCGSGPRSMMAGSPLERAGAGGATVVLGGTAAWNARSCPFDRRGCQGAHGRARGGAGAVAGRSG